MLSNCAFSVDLKDAYLHIHIIKNHCQFLHFVWQHKQTLSMEGFAILVGYSS